MIDSYLTAGLTRGLSLALSPQATLRGTEMAEAEKRRAYREGNQPRRWARAAITTRLARFMRLLRVKPEPSSQKIAEAASCRS